MAISDVGETSIDRTETVIPLSHVSYRYFTGFYLHRLRSLHFTSLRFLCFTLLATAMSFLLFMLSFGLSVMSLQYMSMRTRLTGETLFNIRSRWSNINYMLEFTHCETTISADRQNPSLYNGYKYWGLLEDR